MSHVQEECEKDPEEGLLNFLADAMLVFEWKSRATAQDCWDEGLDLVETAAGGSITPKPTAFSLGVAAN